MWVWVWVPVSAVAAEGEEPTASVAQEATPRAPAPSPSPSPSVAPRAALDPFAPTASTLASPGTSSRKPFAVAVSIDHSVGSGTFVSSTWAYVGAKLTVSPSYAFAFRGVNLVGSANATGAYEYTPPNNLTGRRYDWGDIGLHLSAPSFFTEEKLTGIALSANLAATLPIALQSRWANVITSFSGGLSLSRTLGPFTLGGRVGASKTFYSSLERRLPDWLANRRDAQDKTDDRAVQVADKDPSAEALLFICRSDPNGCLISGGGMDGVPPLWALSGGVGARYAPREKLSFAASFSLGKTFKYVVGVGPLSTRAVDSNGTPVADAQGQSDLMVGSLGASYRLTDAIAVSLQMATIQAPLTADGRALRFPFFAFRNLEDSYTSYSLSFAGSY
jgi:hypothetical protein